MHTVELLEAALRAAENLGYQIRREWLGGVGGGPAEFGGRRYLFIDLSLSTSEQLEQALPALTTTVEDDARRWPAPLRRMAFARRAA